MSFDGMYPDDVQAGFVSPPQRSSYAASMREDAWYPDTDAFWRGGAALVREQPPVRRQAVMDDLPDSLHNIQKTLPVIEPVRHMVDDLPDSCVQCVDVPALNEAESIAALLRANERVSIQPFRLPMEGKYQDVSIYSIYPDETLVDLPESLPSCSDEGSLSLMGVENEYFDELHSCDKAVVEDQRSMIIDSKGIFYPDALLSEVRSLVPLAPLAPMIETPPIPFHHLGNNPHENLIPTLRPLTRIPQPLGFYDNDPWLQTPSYYGRAAGTLRTLGCSAWNSGGNFLITAGHCLENNGVFPSVANFPVTFGTYDTAWNIPTVTGLRYVLERLEQLGISIHQIISVDGVKINSLVDALFALDLLMNFNCQPIDTALDAPPCSLDSTDVAFARCNSRRVVFKTYPAGREETAFVSASNIFGHIPITIRRELQRPNLISNQGIYILGQNCWANNLNCADIHGLIFPCNLGGINRASQVYLGRGRFTQLANRACFGQPGLQGDWYGPPGSSGSALFMPFDFIDGRLVTNRAVGVQSYCTWNAVAAAPIGAFLPDLARRYSLEGVPNPISLRYLQASTVPMLRGKSVGALDGHHGLLRCPTGFAVAGVIGSSVNPNLTDANRLDITNLDRTRRKIGTNRIGRADRVGNFGIVCMPYADPRRYDQAFAKASVLATGSIDVSTLVNNYFSDLHHTTSPVPIDVYMNDILSTYGAFGREYLDPMASPGFPMASRAFQQELTMCPPGYYMSALWPQVGSNGLIEGIYAIGCQRWDGTEAFWKETNIGTVTPPLSQQQFSCGRNGVIDGVEFFSRLTLRGIRAITCKGLPPM